MDESLDFHWKLFREHGPGRLLLRSDWLACWLGYMHHGKAWPHSTTIEQSNVLPRMPRGEVSGYRWRSLRRGVGMTELNRG